MKIILFDSGDLDSTIIWTDSRYPERLFFYSQRPRSDQNPVQVMRPNETLSNTI